MKFLVDRCAGRTLALWLRSQGHDVADLAAGPDPGDRALLEQATREQRVLVTLDSDFGRLVFVDLVPHRGLVRLPDVAAQERIRLMQIVLTSHQEALAGGSIVTVRGGRIRISRPGP